MMGQFTLAACFLIFQKKMKWNHIGFYIWKYMVQFDINYIIFRIFHILKKIQKYFMRVDTLYCIEPFLS
jgi:hypothetical protein